MTKENKAWIVFASLIFAIIALPNPYGTWLVALIIIVGAVIGGMDMVNSDKWTDGLFIAVVITIGLLVMVFIGSGGGGGGEVP